MALQSFFIFFSSKMFQKLITFNFFRLIDCILDNSPSHLLAYLPKNISKHFKRLKHGCLYYRLQYIYIYWDSKLSHFSHFKTQNTCQYSICRKRFEKGLLAEIPLSMYFFLMLSQTFFVYSYDKMLKNLSLDSVQSSTTCLANLVSGPVRSGNSYNQSGRVLKPARSESNVQGVRG